MVGNIGLNKKNKKNRSKVNVKETVDVKVVYTVTGARGCYVNYNNNLKNDDIKII